MQLLGLVQPPEAQRTDVHRPAVVLFGTSTSAMGEKHGRVSGVRHIEEYHSRLKGTGASCISSLCAAQAKRCPVLSQIAATLGITGAIDVAHTTNAAMSLLSNKRQWGTRGDASDGMYSASCARATVRGERTPALSIEYEPRNVMILSTPARER